MARVLGERYLLESVLGTGGMARVYLALDQRLGRKVAVKVMAEKQGANRRAFYFQREARSIAALKHSGIVQIYDFSGPDENPSYIVEELLEGVDADQVLEKNRKIDPKVLVVIAHSMAAALAHAHSQGVIHRDIKPSN
ncbi:serine/threonine protein kinase, partial [Myxococcota bacterium]|nr:serine/threonine protein kinase [Myxococcota bacterium]